MKPFGEITKNIPLERPEMVIQPSADDIGGMTHKQAIDAFYERLKTTWNTEKYGKIQYMAIQQKIFHLKKNDLHYLFKKCERSSSFSTTFWYELDLKKHK